MFFVHSTKKVVHGLDVSLITRFEIIPKYLILLFKTYICMYLYKFLKEMFTFFFLLMNNFKESQTEDLFIFVFLSSAIQMIVNTNYCIADLLDAVSNLNAIINPFTSRHVRRGKPVAVIATK